MAFPTAKSLALAAVAALWAWPALGQADKENKEKKKPPIVLETQGVFWAGGQIVNRTQPGLENNQILVGQAYVEYFIPHNKRKNAIPLILTHSGISGVVWRTTADGREGWSEFFVRRGFPVYVIDPPGIGRAGFDVDQINLAARGLIPPFSNNPLGHGDSQAWPRWNVGPAFGVLGDGIIQGNQMPNDAEALKRFLAVMPPSGPSPSPGGSQSAFIAVLEKTGPAIWIGWSAGGGLGQTLAVARPDLFKALVTLEAFPCPASAAVANALVTNHVPFLNINTQAGHSTNTGHAREVCQTLVDGIVAAGGTATQLQLPDLGIHGNSHMDFWEKNSDEIAQLVVDWIEQHVERKRK